MGREKQIVLREGVLNDDILVVAHTGRGFNNNRSYKFMVVWYSYQNEWGNVKHSFCATKLENAIKRYEKIRGRFSEDEMNDILDAMA